MDVVDPETRSRMMSGIRSKDTKPEMIIRRGLHVRGFRYRLHSKNLAGKPDLVFPRYRAVVFVNGCFWHGHDCHLFKMPSSRQEFWRTKIERTRSNDVKVRSALKSCGWRISTVWECAIRAHKDTPEILIDALTSWITSTGDQMELR